jgi:hypothetical protein
MNIPYGFPRVARLLATVLLLLLVGSGCDKVVGGMKDIASGAGRVSGEAADAVKSSMHSDAYRQAMVLCTDAFNTRLITPTTTRVKEAWPSRHGLVDLGGPRFEEVQGVPTRYEVAGAVQKVVVAGYNKYELYYRLRPGKTFGECYVNNGVVTGLQVSEYPPEYPIKYR